MKSYKQILEAINRGILLALDDFNDEEQVLNVKSKLINHKDYTKEYLDLMKDVVDLELPSGTLWCKYNLDVDPNLLSKAKDWYGKYYAWGELKGYKKLDKNLLSLIHDFHDFDWVNYKYGGGIQWMNKYCSNSEYGYHDFTDNLTELLPEDDAAYLNKKLYNFKFHIPTKELCEELIKYTSNYWIKNYDPNKLDHNSENDNGIKGLNGRVFEGKNGNLLFIPAAGYYDVCDIYKTRYECCLWSSSLTLIRPTKAYRLCMDSHDANTYRGLRYVGCSIRPVINL